jgi:hypothetical protein
MDSYTPENNKFYVKGMEETEMNIYSPQEIVKTK